MPEQTYNQEEPKDRQVVGAWIHPEDGEEQTRNRLGMKRCERGLYQPCESSETKACATSDQL